MRPPPSRGAGLSRGVEPERLKRTTSAPFGHQMLLSLPENAHFDPVKRGLALAIAGRSVGVEASGTSALADAAGRRAVLQEFNKNWEAMEYSFSGAFEISGTMGRRHLHHAGPYRTLPFVGLPGGLRRLSGAA